MSESADTSLQELCELGQRQLMEMRYLDAERTLVRAESAAWTSGDFDTLGRLYMPLQEARRQRRQRCGDGIVRLDLLAETEGDRLDGHHVVENYPHGQLLVAGWGTIEPALRVRSLAVEHDLFVETFLGAVFPVGESARVVVIVPLEDVKLPPAEPMGIDSLLKQLPPHSIVLPPSDLPAGDRRGTPATYGQVMDLWERLHAPFLAAADAASDPMRKLEGFRKTIRVDYACELAHQKFSDVARNLAKKRAAVT